ncbi:MAG TPA: LacI family DNA-binding transcriptional regulator [Streptosporangiaceae bacterium]|nr:LacI family DNA-binding transcriptional regulator [Streptosporangiaceae bacterium]
MSEEAFADRASGTAPSRGGSASPAPAGHSAATSRPPTLREVAEAARVDPSTVSRALRPATQRMVRPDTLARVLATAEMLGYRANPFARGLKNQRSMTIGMLLPDLANPLFPPIVRGIEDGLRGDGYVLILANTDRDQARERSLVDALMTRRVDGMILATAERTYPLLDELVAVHMPVVLVNRAAEAPAVPTVSSNVHQGIGLAVKHLVELGHRRIAHVGGARSISTGFLRHQHFHAWMQSLGLSVDNDLVVFADWFTKDLGARACEELLDRTTDFTAIVAANDLIALGCYTALRRRGLSVPQDVSVIGYNGSGWCDDVNPPLTSVHVPKYELGLRAAALLLEAVEARQTVPATVLLPTTLDIRQSTAPPRM